MTADETPSDRQPSLSTEDVKPVAPEEVPAAHERPGGQDQSEEAKDAEPHSMLRRVSTAVMQGKELEDEAEEAAVWPVQRHWEKLFIDGPTGFEQQIYLVLDGLDECDETEAVALCAAINASSGALPKRAAPNVHVLLLMNTDRFHMLNNEILTNATDVRIDHEINTADVSRFVCKRITSAWKKKLVCEKIRQDSREAIMQKSDCNFLRASLLVDEVTSLTREDYIRSRLSNLPDTTEAAMLLVIDRLGRELHGHHREDFHVSKILCKTSDVMLTCVGHSSVGGLRSSRSQRSRVGRFADIKNAGWRKSLRSGAQIADDILLVVPCQRRRAL